MTFAMSYRDEIPPMRAVDEHLVSMANPSQPAPNAGVSCSVSQPSPAHHGLGSDNPVMSPQTDAAPTSPLGYLPADHGNGSVSIAECNTGASISPGLPEAGMRLEEWLTTILKEAEEALDKARRTLRRHRWVLWSVPGFGAVFFVGGLAATAIKGTPSVPAILGWISSCVALCLMGVGCCLLCQYEAGYLEAASRRARELKPFARDLRRFMLDESRFIVDWPEAEAKEADYRRQLRMIMKGGVQIV